MENLTPEEKSVYDLIASNNRITQLQLARKVFVGSHDKFENYDNPKQSTLRQVRQIIRDLRLNHNLPVLSDVSGYYILKTQQEAEEFVHRLEKSARAQAKSLMITYNALKRTLGVKNEYFEKESDKIIVREHTRQKNKSIFPNNQNKLF